MSVVTTNYKMPIVRMKETTLNGKGTLILTKDLMDQIDYLHKKVGAVEWCGILFYRKISGEIHNPENFVLQAEQIYPMNIGSEAYTEADVEGIDIIEMYEKVPNAEMLKQGLIHTHHTMQAFFSGTDMAELHDNSPLHNYYLSLIVNFRGEYVAKIAYVAEIETITNKAVVFTDSTDTKQSLKSSTTNTEKVLVMMDLNIQKPAFQEVVPEYFQDRYQQLQIQRENRRALAKANYYSPSSYPDTGGATYTKTSEIKKGYFNQGELFDRGMEEEKSPSKAQRKAQELQTSQKTSGKLVNTNGKYISAKKEEIRDLLLEWLTMGTDIENDMVPTKFSTLWSGIKYFDEYYSKKGTDLDYFLKSMQAYASNVFDDFEPRLVRRMATEQLSVHLDTSIGTDFYNIFDAMSLIDVTNDPEKAWEQKEIKKSY